jgi:hypothetical protein
MTIAILSILILTLLVWISNKILPVKVCSICAGVTLTWLWMFSGMWLGLLSVSRYEFITAVLMGASIGGIVTELKKIFLKLRNRGETKNKKVESLENKLKDCC